MVRSITARELDDAMCGEERMLLLDVRSRSEHDLHPEAIPGSQWRDPATADTWLPSIPEGANAVVYCEGGGEPSRGIQSRLTTRGVAARYLEGGLAAWQRQHGGEHGEPGGTGGSVGSGGAGIRAGEGCAHSPVRGEPGGHIPAGGESGLHRPAGNGTQHQPGRRGSEAGGHEHARVNRSGPADATGGGIGGGEGGGAR